MAIIDLLPKKHYLGVDIGTTSIKAAEIIVEGPGQFRLVNYAIIEIYGYLEKFTQVFQTSSLKLSVDEASKFLTYLIKSMNPGTKKVIASLPTFSAFTTLIELPVLNEKEIQQAVATQGRKYIPIPIATATLDWESVGEKTSERGEILQQVFLIAIPNEVIEEHKKVFKNSNLQLTTLELENVSLARLLTYDINDNVLIVDIGTRTTNLCVAKAGVLKFIDQTDFAGASLTQAIGSALGINSQRAEILKLQRGLSPDFGLDILTIMKPILDVILNEAQRAMNNFELNYNEKVSGIILTGGGSNLKGLTEYFKSFFNIPVRRAFPMEKILYPKELEPIKDELGLKLAVAIGLGIR